MSKKKSPTERYAHTLGMTVDEFIEARWQSDHQIVYLQKWLRALDCGITVKRSRTDFEKFVFYRDGGISIASVSYKRAASFCAGLAYGLRIKRNETDK